MSFVIFSIVNFPDFNKKDQKAMSTNLQQKKNVNIFEFYY